MEEAAKILKLKAARYETLLGIKLLARRRYVPRSPALLSTQMYDSYAATKPKPSMRRWTAPGHIIQGARKSRTFFFNGLSADRL